MLLKADDVKINIMACSFFPTTSLISAIKTIMNYKHGRLTIILNNTTNYASNIM